MVAWIPHRRGIARPSRASRLVDEGETRREEKYETLSMRSATGEKSSSSRSLFLLQEAIAGGDDVTLPFREGPSSVFPTLSPDADMKRRPALVFERT